MRGSSSDSDTRIPNTKPATPMSSPPHYRWYILALTLVNQAVVVGILIYSFALFVVPWLQQFDISRSHAMVAIFLFQVMSGLASPMIGRLLDKHSMRLLVMLGGFCLSLGLLLLSMATAFWQIILIHATLLPLGILLAGVLASQTMVSKWFVHKRSLAIGISAMGTSMGGFIFPLITGGLISQFDWQTSLLVLAGMSLVLLMPLNYIILRFEPPSPVASDPLRSSLDTKIWTTREILTSRNFWLPVIAIIPLNASFGGVQFNIGAYIFDLGFEQTVAAQLISITALSMIGGKFIFGSLGDRVDHRWLYWLMASLMMAALALYEGSPSLESLRLGAVLLGVATGGILPMTAIMFSARFGTFAFGRVLGYVNLFLMMGSFGPIFSGWMFDRMQSYDPVFWIFGISLLPCMFAMLWLPAPDTALTATGLEQEPA